MALVQCDTVNCPIQCLLIHHRRISRKCEKVKDEIEMKKMFVEKCNIIGMEGAVRELGDKFLLKINFYLNFNFKK